MEQAKRFFGTRVWAAHLDEASRGRALLYRASRILYATVRGFRDKDLPSRAASLTYYSVLSIVPFLAFAFSILKGFGGYQRLMDQAVRPYIAEAFAGNPTLLKALEQMLSFVENTNVSGLSVVGVLLLAYTSITMLSTVETALNDIWEARAARPVIRKVTDYTTLMVFGPLLVAVAIAFSATAQSSTAVEYLHRSTLLGGILDFLLGLTSVVFVCVALVALYIIMPNVRSRVLPAVIGGIVAGLLWQGALLLHVKFQIGVARYNALYSGFAAIPIFLVWLYVSWTIVLLGAQLAASLQYEKRMTQAVRSRHVDQELKESLVVVIAAAVCRRFLEGAPPPTAAALARALGVPLPAVDGALDALVEASILVRVVEGGELAYDPGRDVDAVRMVDVEDAVRVDREADPIKGALERAVGPSLSTLLRSRHEVAPTDAGALTLRQLASQCTVRFEPITVESPSATHGPGLLDGKQPTVPA
jgi:membrane protein